MARRLSFAVAILVLIGALSVPAQAGGPVVAQADLKIAKHKSGPFLVNDLYIQAPAQYGEQRVKKTAEPGEEKKFYLKLQHDTGVGGHIFEIHADADATLNVESTVRGYRGWTIDPAKELVGSDGVPVFVDEGASQKLLLVVKIKGVSEPGRVDWVVRAVQPMGPLLDVVVARTKVV